MNTARIDLLALSLACLGLHAADAPSRVDEPGGPSALAARAFDPPAAHPQAAAADPAAPAPAWQARIRAYLEGLSRPDGGYAWEGQSRSHLTPSFSVVACYRVLNQAPPKPRELAQFIRTRHPARLKKLEQEHPEFEFQQIQGLLWLGEDAAELREPIRLWTKPIPYLRQYERHGHPVLRHQLAAFACRALLGLPLEDLAADFVPYLESRRRANGSFNNTPVADGGDGHVLNTLWGLEAMDLLRRAGERRAETVAWLQACQLPNGGFTWQPQPEFAGVDSAAYTWAAVMALRRLGAEPARRDACLEHLQSLWNEDGGFGDSPGCPSNPMATRYALEALQALGGLASLKSHPPRPRPPVPALPPTLKVYTIQIEAHGQGSPAEAVDLARALRIHLWGAKNARPDWLARAQSIADRQNVPARFFIANEEYGAWIDVPGLGTYSHISDVVAPPGVGFGPSLAGPEAIAWPEFRRRRLGPLDAAGGRLIWQFGENEELVRLFLDDSIEHGGYAAISTYHFGNPDFCNSEPFLACYRGRIPFVALQDAHGVEPWWFADMTAGFRTLFLAEAPTWEGWLNALCHQWVAAVRHDAASGFETWIHSSSNPVREFVLEREPAWRWWDHPAIQRPMVSIVAVRPEDPFEAARPESGVTIRVRCAWQNTTQGLPKTPIAELVRLTVDGAEAAPTIVAPRSPRAAAYTDYYHACHLAAPAPGPHSATAVVREIQSGRISSRTIQFEGASPNPSGRP